MNVINLPPKKVWVRKEYLRDLRDGHEEYIKGWWVSAKSIWGKCFYFETYLPDYGALYDKLPISAFLDFESSHPLKPRKPTPDLPLSDLQYWDSFDYDIKIIEKQFLHSMAVEVKHRSNHVSTNGKYLFTIDSHHSDRDIPDLTFSELPEEHKSHNCIILPNGQIGLYPNNRCRWTDESLSPPILSKPDFLVSTRSFSVEHGGTAKLGNNEDYFWDYPKQEKQIK